MREVDIVFSSNDDYCPYLQVAVISIINNISDDNFYHFHILFSKLELKNQKKIENIILAHSNCDIAFWDVSSFFSGDLFVNSGKNAYLSEETYYRLAIIDILPQKDFVIYLDCDIVVNVDLARLYTYDWENYMVLAVEDYAGNCIAKIENSDIATYRRNVLQLSSPTEYFNAGVLGMNLNAIRKKYTTKQLIELARERQWQKHDQDVLNVIMKKNVLWLEKQWNLIEYNKNVIKDFVDEDELENYALAQKDPYIIHFATQKPWIYLDVFGAESFWKYAAQTPDYFYILQKLAGQIYPLETGAAKIVIKQAIKGHSISIKFCAKALFMAIISKFS